MTPSSFTCALHATHRRRQPGSMMMIAVRRRSGTGRAGPATGLDQPSSAGATAALPGCGRDMDVMYPARCDCAQPAWEYLHGVKMELQSCRTLPAALCGMPAVPPALVPRARGTGTW